MNRRAVVLGVDTEGLVDRERTMIAFGPVPSRRLGRSLGINNIPPKICTYSCVYCQLGRTSRMQVERHAFYEPDDILYSVKEKMAKAKGTGEAIDYLAFVPDGEPTLDIHLGQEIELLRPLGLPIAVITNASLIWRQDVRADLMGVDWVSLKIDAVEDRIWQQVSRPHGRLKLASILRAGQEFGEAYGGELVTEVMLVAGVNDGEEHLRAIADHLGRLQPTTAYLSIASRPPAEKWVRIPDEATINLAYQIFSEKVERVEYLVGYEGDEFSFTGDTEEDLLSITAVHPMREEAVCAFLAQAGAEWATVRKLVARDQLVRVEYGDHKFYLRKLGTHSTQTQ